VSLNFAKVRKIKSLSEKSCCFERVLSYKMESIAR
jgi:hypothetical protein